MRLIFAILFLINMKPDSAHADLFTSQTWFPGNGNVRFVDLTGQMYSGPDEDLIGIRLEKMGIHCAGYSSYRGLDAIISWEDNSSRFLPAQKGMFYPSGLPTQSLRSYQLHIRVRDRRQKVVHEEDFDYVPTESTFVKGHVNHSHSGSDGCDRDYVALSNSKLNLAYSTIEFWFRKTDWGKK